MSSVEAFHKQDIRACARSVYEYLKAESPREETSKGNIIMTVGGPNLEAVADKAYQLWVEDPSRTIMAFTSRGYYSSKDVTEKRLREAELYRSMLVEKGVPEEKIYVNPEATNTTEEARLAAAYIGSLDERPEGVLLVDIPVHQMRAERSMQYELQSAGIDNIKLVNCPINDDPQYDDLNFLLRLVSEMERLTSYVEIEEPPSISTELLRQTAILRRYLAEQGVYNRKRDHPRQIYENRRDVVSSQASTKRRER